MEARPIYCSACGRRLDPNLESIVYFAWGKSMDRAVGPMLPLCSTTIEQLDAGLTSACVASALKLFQAARITPIPATYSEWLESSQAQADHLEDRTASDFLFSPRQAKFS